ncbi:hypothetical protein F5Y14DRAFT_44828 [Nemania sp. NC0429]|nr:hypothetical protein F5Y14DRAFT_44828 [Nemania sp. NC0429]
MTFFIDGVALVTGAASGIGRECALAYAAEGARGVVVADLNLEAAEKVAQECEETAASSSTSHQQGFKALAVSVDVGDRVSVDAMVQSTIETFGRIDYCVNSAGVGVRRHVPVDETDAEEMDRFWRVNVMGTFHCIQAVTKVMKEQDIATVISPRGGGRREVGRGAILNLGSLNSYVATPNIVQYTTSKHAIMGLTKNAALDNAAYGIRVNAICPGWVETPMVSAAMEGNPELPKMMKAIIPMRRIAKVDEIADVVLFMTSPRSSYVTGAGWLVDGGTGLQVQTM